jgi:hypothetical protein
MQLVTRRVRNTSLCYVTIKHEARTCVNVYCQFNTPAPYLFYMINGRVCINGVLVSVSDACPGWFGSGYSKKGVLLLRTKGVRLLLEAVTSSLRRGEPVEFTMLS